MFFYVFTGEVGRLTVELTWDEDAQEASNPLPRTPCRECSNHSSIWNKADMPTSVTSNHSLCTFE